MRLTITLFNVTALILFTNGGDVMNKQIVAIFLTLMMIGTIFVIAPSDLQVGASGGGGDNGIGLNYSYIKEKTEELSYIIFNEYLPGELAKGRAFGTKGERAAAEDIADWMEEIGLYNVTLEPIENVSTESYSYVGKSIVHPFKDITDKLEILEGELIVNGTPIVDFFITPRWNSSGENRDKLTYTFEENELQVIGWQPLISFAEYVVVTLRDAILNLTSDPIIIVKKFLNGFLLDYVKEQLENDYNFSFEDISAEKYSELPWYNETVQYLSRDWVFIDENPTVNPNKRKVFDSGPLIKSLFKNPISLPRLWWRSALLLILKDFWYGLTNSNDKKCKGFIFYDHNDDTYDMEIASNNALPTIHINKTLGNEIKESMENNDFYINYTLNQRYNKSTESYNVIGQINGTDSNKTVIICSLYDCWWNQGTADSAIGMAMVLAIAKYMKKLDDLGIKPKCNVKFIAFGGEEYGWRGAWSYEANHSEENIKIVIDLNQLGYYQPDRPSTLNILSSKHGLPPSGYHFKNLLRKIGEKPIM